MMLFIYCTTRVKRATGQLIIFWRVTCQKPEFIGDKSALIYCVKRLREFAEVM